MIAAYARAHLHRFVDDLAALVSFPSVSAQPTTSAVASAACARWLVDKLKALGSHDARLVATPGAPVVVGTIDGATDSPHVLVYTHYDVQPASPTWRPFEPRLRDGYLVGRGASDDKGQIVAHLAAAESIVAVRGRLPVPVTFVIEGEEEIGSPHLAPVLDEIHADVADVAVISDTPVLAIDRPSLTCSLRGDVYLDVRVRGADGDRHSGTYGGGADNAVHALVQALAGLHDRDGYVHVPGLASSLGARQLTASERSTTRPSIEISGLVGGYTGDGVHGVIPASARAKLDVRLIEGQHPDAAHRAVFAQLARRLPDRFELVTTEQARAEPVVVDRDHWSMRAAARAYRRGFGVWPDYVRAGGSIPAVHHLAPIPTVLMGYALPDDRAHGPHERYSLALLGKAIATAAAFLDEVSS